MERPTEAVERARDWTLWIAASSLLASMALTAVLTLHQGFQPAGHRGGVNDVNPLQRSAAEAAESYLHAWCAGRPGLAAQLAQGRARERLAARASVVDAGSEKHCAGRPNFLVDETHYGQDGSVRLIGTSVSRTGTSRLARAADLLVAPSDQGWQVQTAHLSPQHPATSATAHPSAHR